MNGWQIKKKERARGERKSERGGEENKNELCQYEDKRKEERVFSELKCFGIHNFNESDYIELWFNSVMFQRV